MADRRTSVTIKKRKPHDLTELLAGLPEGRRRVAETLVGGPAARTYPEVARLLGIHVGSVHAHLRRVRLLHPEVYEALMEQRAAQLLQRHTEAEARAAAHSQEYFWRKRNNAYRRRFGYWPWERWNRRKR